MEYNNVLGFDFMFIGLIVIYLFGLYLMKYDDVDDIKKGDMVVVLDDVLN